MTLKSFQQISLIILGLVVSTTAFANNLSVGNVSLSTRNPSAKTIVVAFDLSWNNSWRNKINHDAVWLSIRLANSQDSSLGSTLCQVSAAGLNPAGTSTGSASNLEIYVPADKVGAFVRRSSNGAVADVATTNMQVTVNYNSCGFADNDQVSANVIGLEMVYIPQGSFFAGDYNTSTASLNKGTGDNSPWAVSSEAAIAVTNPASNGYRYVSAGNSGEFATGASFSIPANFPKGYTPFYTMKYEISEGQWVDFVNALPAAARLNRDVTDNNHKNSDAVIARNTVSCSGSPLFCSTTRSWRAMTFLSWMDLAAYLDWAGLRPMSELEFEKSARGPVLPVKGEYVWGSTDVVATSSISGQENGAEQNATLLANANYANSTLSGGDSANGAEYQNGALRTGIFATSDSTRVLAGGSYYGLLDLSGNVAERVVTIGNSSGLNFDGTNGDGVLSTVTGYEGNANQQSWPGIDADLTKGITGAAGSGFKGGSWLDAANMLRTSDRAQAALTSAAATSSFGGRGARTYDGT